MEGGEGRGNIDVTEYQTWDLTQPGHMRSFMLALYVFNAWADLSPEEMGWEEMPDRQFLELRADRDSA